jgi:uncharacterized membrane protein
MPVESPHVEGVNLLWVEPTQKPRTFILSWVLLLGSEELYSCIIVMENEYNQVYNCCILFTMHNIMCTWAVDFTKFFYVLHSQGQSDCTWNKMKHVPKQIISILHTFMNQTKEIWQVQNSNYFVLSHLQASILTIIILHLQGQFGTIYG